MNTRTRLIRGWLLQQPRPSAVRVKSGDDQQTIEVGVMKWAAIASSIDALDPDIIEALDDKGKLVRAIKADQLDDSVDDEDGTTPASKAAASKQLDREMAMLVKFGELLAKAYEHSTSVAFGKMVELFDAVAKRGESLEKSLASTERLLRRAQEAGAVAGDDEPSLLGSMLEAFAGAQQQNSVEKTMADAVASKAHKTNGKGQQI